MADKKFILKIFNREARPRSKRLRELGGGNATGSATVISGAGGGNSGPATGDGHTHANLADLDRMTTDANGYIYLRRLAEGDPDPETGETNGEVVEEKVRAGYADDADHAVEADHAASAYDLDADSPVRRQFLSRLADDMAEGLITFKKGLVALLKSAFKGGAEFGTFAAGQTGAAIDADGNAEVETLLARKSAQVSTEFVPGASGGKIWVDDYGNVHVQTDILSVTKRAEIAEVDIKKLRHTGGSIMLSPASMECDSVVDDGDGWLCHFKTEDGEGRAIVNEFREGDLARCQAFNLRQGTSQNVATRYYWRRVMATGDDYIKLSKTDCDPATKNDTPAAGDSIVCCGSKTDPAGRGNVIIISSYGAGAPSILQFNGIDNYVLPESKLCTRLSPDGNLLRGQFEVLTSNGTYAKFTDVAATYRVEVENTAAEVGTDESPALRLTTTAKAYRIIEGELHEITAMNGSNIIIGKAGSDLLSVGGGLFRLYANGEVNGGDPSVYRLTVVKKNSDGTAIGEEIDYTESILGISTEESDLAVASIEFKLYRNGALVAVRSVEGLARLRYTSASLKVLNDRITSEVTAISGTYATKSEVEQTAQSITSTVRQDLGTPNLLPDTARKTDRWLYSSSPARAILTATDDGGASLHKAIIESGTETVSYQTLQYRFDASTLEPDTDYTLSFEFEALNGIAQPVSIGLTAHISDTNGSNSITGSSKAVSTSADNGRRHVTLHTRSTLPADLGTKYVIISVAAASYKAWRDISVKRLKLERGAATLTAYTESYAHAESMIQQTATQIRQEVTTDLGHAGITIDGEDSSITLDAHTTKVNGNFYVPRVLAVSADGKTIASMNAKGTGEYIMYYPGGGPKFIEFKPTANVDEVIMCYDENGAPLWSLGKQGYKVHISEEWRTIGGYASVSSGTDPQIKSAEPLGQQTLYIFRKEGDDYDGHLFEKKPADDSEITTSLFTGYLTNCEVQYDGEPSEASAYRSVREVSAGVWQGEWVKVYLNV